MGSLDPIRTCSAYIRYLQTICPLGIRSCDALKINQVFEVVSKMLIRDQAVRCQDASRLNGNYDSTQLEVRISFDSVTYCGVFEKRVAFTEAWNAISFTIARSERENAHSEQRRTASDFTVNGSIEDAESTRAPERVQ